MNIQIRATVRKRADGTIDTEELIIELKDDRETARLVSGGTISDRETIRQSRWRRSYQQVKAMYVTLPASKNAKQAIIMGCKPQEVRFPKVIKVNAWSSADSKGFLQVFPSPNHLRSFGPYPPGTADCQPQRDTLCRQSVTHVFAEENYCHGVILLRSTKEYF